MGWQDLVCVACAGRVVEGRCPTCRAAREQFRAAPASMAPLLVAAGAMLALLLLLLLPRL